MAKKTKQDNPEMEQAPVEQQAPETVQEQAPETEMEQVPVEQTPETVQEQAPEPEQVTPVNEPQAPAEPVCCVVSTNGRGLNLREVPDGKVRKILPDGCAVLAEDLLPGQEWVWVDVGDLCGWVKSEFLRPVEGGEV